jgi:molybdopterin molybdotransferase
MRISMIDAREALDIIFHSVGPLEKVTMSIGSALDHAAAEDIVSAENVPPFDNAAMDGYAVRSGDVVRVPAALRIVGDIAAGTVVVNALNKGEAMSIMTGAKVPAGCDVVIPQEWTERGDPRHVTILRTAPSGHAIRRAGMDVRSGATVLSRGCVIRPQEIGVLASLGKRFVIVHRKPEIAILTTGSEVVEIDRPLTEGKIRNSNAAVLTALARRLGCPSSHLGIAPDEKERLKAMLIEGLNSDLLLTSGGVSVGKYDLVMEALREIGGTVKFWKVNIKPGMPLLFVLCREKPVFGLPGNPVSAMVTFLEFVRPALLRMMGRAHVPSFRLHARLEEQIRKSDGKRHFVRGILTNEDGALRVRTTGSQESNMLTSLSRADCLIILPEDRKRFRPGEEVEVELL